MDKADIGIIGLAVMGGNLAINIESKGFSVNVYNRTARRTDEFVGGRACGKSISGAHTLAELAGSLKSPRKIMLMVKAGEPVDECIEALVPLLDEGDVIIDGGNSHFADSIRRAKYLESKGLLFVGTGISGGEEGALTGSSIMPGGSPKAWPLVEPIFRAIAAKAEDGTPCCDWMGNDGAGHFVKMVHNGIEYGDMQLICEAYILMKEYLGMRADDMHEVFKDWNTGLLDSYLIGITSGILARKDEDGKPLVEKILDAAEQKGMGKWASATAMDEGVPLTLISEAVQARFLSALKDERLEAAGVLKGPKLVNDFSENRGAFIEDVRKALVASKIVLYAQGFALLRAASETYGWELDCGKIALLWRGGCIIRSALLPMLNDAFGKAPGLKNLMMDPFFSDILAQSQGSWRSVCAEALTSGIAIPAFAGALTYYDGYRAASSPANLMQAMRDYFGAHTYERTDKPRGEMFHTDWAEN